MWDRLPDEGYCGNDVICEFSEIGLMLLFDTCIYVVSTYLCVLLSFSVHIQHVYSLSAWFSSYPYSFPCFRYYRSVHCPG